VRGNEAQQPICESKEFLGCLLRRIGLAFSSAFAQTPRGLKNIPTEAENALSAATAPGQWAQPDCFGLDVAAALFFPLFLLGRSRNLRERGGGRGDLRLLLFRLLGFTVATNLTFRHRNSPFKEARWLRALHHPAAVVSVRSRPIDQTTRDKKSNPRSSSRRISLPQSRPQL
jgi:hypothetical protein